MRSAPAGAAYGWMAVSSTLFAAMNYFGRVAAEGTHWTGVAASRALVGCLVAVAVARLRGIPAFVTPSRTMWIRSVMGTSSLALTFAALADARMPLADTVTLLNLSPIFIALFAPLVLRERGGRRALVALPLSAAGVVLILHPPVLFGGARPALPWGTVLVAVGAALSAAFAMLALRRTSVRETPEAIAAHFSLTAFVCTATAAAGKAVLGGGLPVPSPGGWLALVLAGVCGGGAQLAMTRAYALERAARVSPLGYLSVVVSAVLGAIFLHEPPTPTSSLGIALVLAGGLLLAALGVRDAARNVPPG